MSPRPWLHLGDTLEAGLPGSVLHWIGPRPQTQEVGLPERLGASPPLRFQEARVDNCTPDPFCLRRADPGFFRQQLIWESKGREPGFRGARRSWALPPHIASVRLALLPQIWGMRSLRLRKFKYPVQSPSPAVNGLCPILKPRSCPLLLLSPSWEQRASISAAIPCSPIFAKGVGGGQQRQNHLWNRRAAVTSSAKVCRVPTMSS